MSIITNVTGQLKLKKYFSERGFLELPHSLLFIGEKGSGKKLIAESIATDYYNVPYQNITAQLESDFISDSYTKTEPMVYLIELDALDIKKQGSILKFLEEPPQFIKLILTTSNIGLVLPTLVNRCQVFTLEPYSFEELSTFSANSELLCYCSTPGQLIYYKGVDIKDIASYCSKIVDKIHHSNKGNLFAISDKIAFKNEKDKYDFELFINVLLIKLREKSLVDFSFIKDYNIVAKYNNLRQQNSSFNQRALFEVMLLDWSLA